MLYIDLQNLCRPSLSLQKQCEEASLFAFRRYTITCSSILLLFQDFVKLKTCMYLTSYFISLGTVIRSSSMDLPGTRFGQSRMILLHFIQMTLLVNPLLICYSNPLKKIWSSGLTGKNFTYSSILLGNVMFLTLLSSLWTLSLCLWPSLSFEFRLRVSLTSDGNLILISRIRNINGKPFSFSLAYQTHFSVSDIR